LEALSVALVELPNSLLDARDVIELGDVVLKFLPAGEIYVPEADETFHPPPVSTGIGSLSTWAKVGIGAGLVAAAGVVLFAMAFGGDRAPSVPLAQSENDGLVRVLSEAKGLLARGDSQAAMQRAERIPAGSNLRNSAEFKLIQSAWADDLFGKAAASSDPTEKRALLDRIARAATLDPARRKRAANELDAMRQAAVNVADLPSEDGISVEATTDSPPAVAAAPTTGDTQPKEAGPEKKAAGVTASKAPTPPPTKASAAQKATKPGTGATLVRQNPFDDP
jgi:hypothetical protein